MLLSGGYHSQFYSREKFIEMLKQVASLHIQIRIKLNPSISSHKKLEETINRIATVINELPNYPENSKLVTIHADEIVLLTRQATQEELKLIF